MQFFFNQLIQLSIGRSNFLIGRCFFQPILFVVSGRYFYISRYFFLEPSRNQHVNYYFRRLSGETSASAIPSAIQVSLFFSWSRFTPWAVLRILWPLVYTLIVQATKDYFEPWRGMYLAKTSSSLPNHSSAEKSSISPISCGRILNRQPMLEQPIQLPFLSKSADALFQLADTLFFLYIPIADVFN